MLSSSAPSLVISPASSSTDQAVLASATDATKENNTPKGTTTAINTGKEDTPSSNVNSNISNSSVYGLSNISQGEICNENGMLKCSGISSYGQCTNGYWVVRDCPIVTVCKENNNSIYCGFS